jgi:predicted nucleic-acid-binding Zn-ribbon protein
MEYETKQISTTGGWVSRVFDFQSNRFTAFICTRCGYTELYKGARSTWANVADILTSG